MPQAKKIAPLVPHGMGGAFVFSLPLQRRRNKKARNFKRDLETPSYIYIICILRL